MTARKRLIVEAAVICFAEKGFEATPTIEIARRAGVAEGTIFRHFENKKDLLLRLVRPLAANVVLPAALDELAGVIAESGGDIRLIMRTMMLRRVAFARLHAPLIRIILQELPFHPELRALLRQEGERFRAAAEAVLTPHAATSGLRPDQVVRLFASVAGSYVILRVIFAPDLDWNDEDEVDATVRFALRGFGLEA